MKNDLISLVKISEEYQYDGGNNHFKYIEGCQTFGTHHWGGGTEPLTVGFKSDNFNNYVTEENCGEGKKLFFKKHFNTYCFWFHLRQQHLLNF